VLHPEKNIVNELSKMDLMIGARMSRASVCWVIGLLLLAPFV